MLRSISDDDICSDCSNCQYRPGAMSGCTEAWPVVLQVDGYILACNEFSQQAFDDDNLVPQP